MKENTIAETGIVTEIRGDKALIDLVQSDACDDCSARILCRPGKNGRKQMLVLNRLKAETGQQVQISEIGNLTLMIAIMQFGLPLLGLLIGVFSVYLTGIHIASIRPELLMALAGFAGVLVGGGITRIWANFLAAKHSCVFEITAITSS